VTEEKRLEKLEDLRHELGILRKRICRDEQEADDIEREIASLEKLETTRGAS